MPENRKRQWRETEKEHDTENGDGNYRDAILWRKAFRENIAYTVMLYQRCTSIHRWTRGGSHMWREARANDEKVFIFEGPVPAIDFGSASKDG